MMSSTPTHYRDLYFEHKNLTRISGEPTFASLHKMLLELKANAVSVPSTLGGGAHGFIGVILSGPTYATLAPMTPFVIPGHTGPLRVVHGATQYEIALAKTMHEESTQTFQTYQLVQRALVQQVLEAIETKYLSSIRNRVTGQVPAEIRALVLHLFRIYGKITPQQLRGKREAVEQMDYKIDEPIAIIFDAIEDLVEISELPGSPYTADQVVDIGYIVLSKNRIFRSDIRKWMRRPEVEKLGLTSFFNLLKHTKNSETQMQLWMNSASTVLMRMYRRLSVNYAMNTHHPQSQRQTQSFTFLAWKHHTQIPLRPSQTTSPHPSQILFNK